MNRATDRITVSPVVSSTKFIFQTGDWCYIFVGNKQYKEYIYIYIYWYQTHPPSPRSPCNKRKMRPGIPWRWGSWLWNEMLFVVHARLEKVKRKEFRQVLQFNFTLFYLFFFCLFVCFLSFSFEEKFLLPSLCLPIWLRFCLSCYFSRMICSRSGSDSIRGKKMSEAVAEVASFHLWRAMISKIMRRIVLYGESAAVTFTFQMRISDTVIAVAFWHNEKKRDKK